jgi:hypothetical protein
MLRTLISVGLSVLLVACSTGRLGQLQSTGNPTSDRGVNYLLGRGVAQDDAKAFYYFQKAANEDDAFAQNEVAYMYAAGKGTKKNYAKAFMYYQKAANHGLATAQYSLAIMYLQGLGTERDQEKGLMWLKRSASAGFEPAQIALKKYSV